MKKSFPGFTVLVERALRVTCIVGVVTLAACGGGTDEADEADAAAATSQSKADQLAVGKLTSTITTTARRTGGIVLSEKVSAPADDAQEPASEEADAAQ